MFKNVISSALTCGLISFAALSGTQSLAQNAPTGWIDDLGASGGLTPSSYALYTTSFTAIQANTTLNFAFRETPAFFSLDDVSVTAHGSATNLVNDPGFESSTVGSNYPEGWGRWIQPVDVSAIGEIASNSAPYGCSGAHGGNLFWCDGSVQGYDGIYQTLATTPGTSYTISFYLADNSGGDWLTSTTGTLDDQIDTLVYALGGVNTIPTGTTSIISPSPEPSAIFLFGIGVAALGIARRQLRKQ